MFPALRAITALAALAGSSQAYAVLVLPTPPTGLVSTGVCHQHDDDCQHQRASQLTTLS